MGEDWQKCIITLLDVVGIKTEAPMSKRASSVMQKLQKLITAKFNDSDFVPKHSHVYLWNDSALLLAYLKEESGERESILREVNKLKRYVDKSLRKSTYAIVVQGRAFPQDELPLQIFDDPLASQPRVIPLKTSSWAMANCFIIENELKKYKKDWYIDIRVTKSVKIEVEYFEKKVKLLPKNEPRTVRMYSGYLW